MPVQVKHENSAVTFERLSLFCTDNSDCSDGWAFMDVLVHEMAHAVYMCAQLATPQFEPLIKRIFENSKNLELWRGSYGGGRVTELFVSVTDYP